MCSSPKSSSTRRRHAKKKALTTAEYEEYSTMLKSSFASYEQAQERKMARMEEASNVVNVSKLEETQSLELTKEASLDKGFWTQLKTVLSYELFSLNKDKYAV